MDEKANLRITRRPGEASSSHDGPAYIGDSGRISMTADHSQNLMPPVEYGVVGGGGGYHDSPSKQGMRVTRQPNTTVATSFPGPPPLGNASSHSTGASTTSDLYQAKRGMNISRVPPSSPTSADTKGGVRGVTNRATAAMDISRAPTSPGNNSYGSSPTGNKNKERISNRHGGNRNGSGASAAGTTSGSQEQLTDEELKRFGQQYRRAHNSGSSGSNDNAAASIRGAPPVVIDSFTPGAVAVGADDQEVLRQKRDFSLTPAPPRLTQTVTSNNTRTTLEPADGSEYMEPKNQGMNGNLSSTNNVNVTANVDNTVTPSRRQGVDEEESSKKGTPQSKKRMYIIIGIVVLLIAVIGGVVGALAGGGDGGGSSPPSSDSMEDGNDNGGRDRTDDDEPTVPDDEYLEFKLMLRPRIENLSPDPAVLDDSDSPQYKALHWLASDYERTFGGSNGSRMDDQLMSRRITNRYSLAVVYFATFGGNWKFNPYFLESSHECDWNSFSSEVGVFCGGGMEEAEISTVKLPDNGLGGTIPHEIAGISSLSELNLRLNGLRGTIPSSFWQLTKISQLELDGNDLTGSIAADIEGMTELDSVDFSGNRFESSLPPALSRLTKLRYFYANENQLSGPIEWLGETSIRFLSLMNNKLTGFLPSDIIKMTTLRQFAVQGNLLSGSIPATLLGLTNLEKFLLTSNDFTGTIPWGSIGSSLRELSVDRNGFVGSFPSDLTNLFRLTSIDLGENEFQGPLPENIGDLSNLKHLSLHTNGFNGAVPSEIGTMTRLTTLRLENNLFTGTIPVELGDLQALEQLALIGNGFSGSVPDNICNIPSLSDIVIEDSFPCDCFKCTTFFGSF